MKTSLIIHGHFYQPPRENPCTGIVPLQKGAKPYDNWNESVYRTCYLPNAHSRYLNPYGKVVDITNNYADISVNFGPTLLSWLDSEHPHFIEKLKEADRASIERTGHSNFLAQCFNHTILPLDSTRTKRVEIAWAIEDYRYRFGHLPEGFWCPECAIDHETIDILADFGIKFTILSPWQATAINGKSLEGKPAPCDRAFTVKGKRNRIAAFFYDPGFASGVSFGHMLHSADALFEKLEKTVSERGNPALVSWATDGEIYGHHEPFGDMALAALIKKVKASENLELTNFGAFLEEHPPLETAQLSLGDDGLGSSWSCSHGVGRWYRNCGCHTGGDDKWNQKWRTPLRRALNEFEKLADEIYYSRIEAMLGSTDKADRLLLNYGKVVCGRKTAQAFLRTVKKKDGSALDSRETETVAILLDAMKNLFFSYASCGWFFNDISGIEPRQNISYALYAAAGMQAFSNINLQHVILSNLRNAISNISSEGTGEDIARRDLPEIPAFTRAAGFFAMNRTIADPSDYTSEYGFFRLISISAGSMKLLNNRTLLRLRLDWVTKADANGSYIISVRNKATGYTYSFTSAQIAPWELRQFSKWVEKRLTSCLEGACIDKLSENIENYMVLINADKSQAGRSVFRENMSLCIKAIKYRLYRNNIMYTPDHIENVRRLAWFARLSGMTAEMDNVREIFDSYMDCFSRLIRTGKFNERNARSLMDILKAARQEGYSPDITALQNAVFPILTGKDASNLGSDTLDELAVTLNFELQA